MAKKTREKSIPLGQIKIEKGVPVPQNIRQRGGQPSPYPWATMKVGDSFAVPALDMDRMKARIWTARRARVKANPKEEYVVVGYEEKGKPVVRCWRMK